MKKGTRILTIIDRSGSMSSIKNDAIGGFNTFLEGQQSVDEEAQMKIVLFDDEYEILCDDDIQNIKTLTTETYIPRGLTALYDAIGKTINDELDYLASIKKKKRFEKYIVVILTDGGENASKEITKEVVNKLISEQEKDFGWEFVFIAANQDAFASAGALGITGNAIFNFTADSVGTSNAYSAMSDTVMSYRSMSKVAYEDNLEDIKKNH